jgi:hypothetical protein
LRAPSPQNRGAPSTTPPAARPLRAHNTRAHHAHPPHHTHFTSPLPFSLTLRPQAGKYGFRIGTFNIFPSFTVTCLMITAMGVLPYYVKYGMSGEQPRAKDDFERYKQQQSYWETVRGVA